MPTELTRADESLFWYWIAERHRIFLKRQAGEPKPWTDDAILRDYKFTNPFRENDRGTVWLRENFIEPHRKVTHSSLCAATRRVGGGYPCDCGMEDWTLTRLAFNICWYRMFNWWGTGKLLGYQTKPFRDHRESIIERLNVELRNGRQVFTGAHIVYSPPGEPKIDAIVSVCDDLWDLCVGPLVGLARKTRRMEPVYNLLRTVHCVGGFMAYEIVTDLRHTPILEDATDILSWANPGPGAKRGLRRLGLPHTPDAKAIESMRSLLEHSKHLGRNSPYDEFYRERYAGDVLNSIEFEMRDIEHSLCEFDKYMRVRSEEGEPRSKFNGRA